MGIMKNDLSRILAKLEGKQSNSGINIVFDEKGISKVRGNDGYTPVKGKDYFTEAELKQIISVIKQASTPVKGKDYFTPQEVAELIRVASERAMPIKGKHYRDGIDGKDGKDAEPLDPKAVAIDAINFLESFEGDARLSAKALKDLDEAVTDILKKGFDFELSESQLKKIQGLVGKNPPIWGGGSGATFLKSLRDVDLSSLTKNADGKYVLGGGSGSSSFLALTDTPSSYTGQAGKTLVVKGTEDGLEYASLSGGGDMLASVYDPQNIASDAFDVDNHTDGTTNKVYTATEKTKLSGIETNADVTDAGNVGSTINGATAKTTPVDADTLPITDSEAANVIKKLSFTNLKAFLKTYFDTLYAATLGADDNYVTDAEKTKLANLSGTNTGDVTVSDSSEIDFTLSGQQISASIVAGSIDESKLDTSVNTSLDLADSALQASAIGVTVQGYSAVLAGTTASFTTADETKLDGIEALADVTDTANVTSAGALMDSEVTDLVFVKALSDATASDVNTGTDANKVVTADALAGSYAGTKTVSVQLSGSATADTALATGDNLATLAIDTTLTGMNLIAVKAYVTTVSSSGAPLFQIRRSRRSSATARTVVDMLSTGVSVDANEFESADATTAVVINTSNDDVQTGDILLFDCDTAGTGTKGATLLLTFQLP